MENRIGTVVWDVGRDRFRLAFRTLNQAEFEQVFG